MPKVGKAHPIHAKPNQGRYHITQNPRPVRIAERTRTFVPLQRRPCGRRMPAESVSEGHCGEPARQAPSTLTPLRSRPSHIGRILLAQLHPSMAMPRSSNSHPPTSNEVFAAIFVQLVFLS